MQASPEIARRQMIDQQVRTWEVLDDRVLDVLSRVSRDRYVPDSFRDVAFADSSIPLGHGQSMLPPKVDGRILQALAVSRGDTVLDVGTGSGFLAACLAALGGSVRSLEIFEDLAASARSALRAEAVTGVAVEVADASRLDETDRYDAIAVTASLPVYDRRFERALKTGGRLFVVTGQSPVMEARLVTRIAADQWRSEALFETVVEPMINAPRPPAFQF
jgi:protein-L-isoaspartate(D-aspartate) O-methyltransferase